jgi:hypothetical protein
VLFTETYNLEKVTMKMKAGALERLAVPTPVVMPVVLLLSDTNIII